MKPSERVSVLLVTNGLNTLSVEKDTFTMLYNYSRVKAMLAIYGIAIPK